MSNPAESYESYMVPVLFGPWAEQLIQAAAAQRGERVLDLACGTGVVARRVAPRVGREGSVTALDMNPAMLEVARAAAAREGLAVEFHEGSAEDLPFHAGSFDLVLCQFALMFFADRRAALAEARRVLVEGGRIALSVWQGLDRHPFYRALHEVIRRKAGVSALQEIFGLGDAGELRRLLLDAGFREARIEEVTMTASFPHPEAFLAAEIDVDTAAIPSMQHLDDDARRTLTSAIADEMRQPLAEITYEEHVVIPFSAHIAHASR
jgi:ubiquinone/menaquinone biosynthesis C-methylase UbiE